MKKRCQIAMEYIVMVGVVFLILIPGMYLFRNYAASTNDQIMDQRINHVAAEILNSAREMYYFGPPSKRVVEVDMPDGIVNMGVYYSDNGASDPSNDEYLLIIAYNTDSGEVVRDFVSDVPILAFDIDPIANPCSANNQGVISTGGTECNGLTFMDCGVADECYCFSPKVYTAGKKFFNMQAKAWDYGLPSIPYGLNCYADSGNCVIIDEVSSEVNCVP